MLILRNKYTAPLYLPHAGKLEGIMLPPGDTPADGKLSALLDALGVGTKGCQMTVRRWLDSGLLAIVEAEEAKPEAEAPEATKAEAPGPVVTTVTVAPLPPLKAEV